MMKKCGVCYGVVIFAALGALNGALVTFMGIDLVTKLTAGMTILYKTFYGLSGASAILLLITLIKPCPYCKK